MIYHWDIIRRAAWQTDFTDAFFLNEHTGWAVGKGGVIAHTTDSGKTWLPQHSGVEADLNQVAFVDPLHGWITGRRMLLRTDDGGGTWQVVRGVLQNLQGINTMQFITPTEGWLGVDTAQILHTTDGGLTWQRQHTGTSDQPITDLHFINSSEGWAVLRDRHEGGLGSSYHRRRRLLEDTRQDKFSGNWGLFRRFEFGLGCAGKWFIDCHARRRLHLETGQFGIRLVNGHA